LIQWIKQHSTELKRQIRLSQNGPSTSISLTALMPEHCWPAWRAHTSMRGRRRVGARTTDPMLQDTPLAADSWSALWAARRSSNSSASWSGAMPRRRDSSEANNDRTTSHTCIRMRSKHCSQVVDHGNHLFLVASCDPIEISKTFCFN